MQHENESSKEVVKRRVISCDALQGEAITMIPTRESRTGQEHARFVRNTENSGSTPHGLDISSNQPSSARRILDRSPSLS